jgi:hypothetical protein
MSTIVTRSGKGVPLTHTELDSNFVNLNIDKAGYVIGEGGSVTQTTDKTTSVTLNKKCGQITVNGSALAANTVATFTLTNSTITATDIIVLNHVSFGTFGNYVLSARAGAGAATIAIRNITDSSLSETLLIGFAVIKATIT